MKFAHAQDIDQMKSISLNVSKLQNWPTPVKSCNYGNISKEENAKPSSDVEDIVQIEDILEEVEPTENLKHIGGQMNSFQSKPSRLLLLNWQNKSGWFC